MNDISVIVGVAGLLGVGFGVLAGLVGYASRTWSKRVSISVGALTVAAWFEFLLICRAISPYSSAIFFIISLTVFRMLETISEYKKLRAIAESLARSSSALDILKDHSESAEQKVSEVYRERDLCVALAANLAFRMGWPCGMSRHSEDDGNWDPRWMNIVFIDTPTGQVSWHIHDSEWHLFEALPRYAKPWDGHTTDEKYLRIGRIVSTNTKAESPSDYMSFEG